MVVVGVTAIVEPVKTPGFQVYVVAPDAVKVPVFPAQIVFEDEESVNVGIEFTFKVMVCELVHPEPLAPVTV